MLSLPPLGGTSFLRNDEYVQCSSCNAEHVMSNAWFCKVCYDKFSKAMEGVNRKMEDLEAKNSFLTSWIETDDDRPSGHSIGPGFADVFLVVKDGPDGVPLRVAAHRFILASRSQVFKKMFETQMEESRSGIVHISKVSYDALQAFVKFLYTAEACLDDQMAWDLLVLAERYEVTYLKTFCEDFMVSRLKWENSVSYYAFAHQQGAMVLLKAALSILLDNIVQLHEHPNYPELVEEQLAVKIYEAHFRKLASAAAPKDTSNQQSEE